jgi:Cysteine-rich secretory protein family
MTRSFTSCAALLLLTLALSPRAIAAPSPAEKQIFDQLNQERKKAGLPALEWNELAADAARRHAALLAENAEVLHQYPNEPSLLERLGATGVRFTRAAENVARAEYIEDVHPGFMDSPGHRANMLSPKYNAAGIGVVEHEGRFYVAQNFIFAVPEYTEEQFSAAFAAGFNETRKSRGFGLIETHNDSYLNNLACSTDGDANALTGSVSGSYLVVFTSSDPRRLPEQMLKAVANPNYRRMNFGVCFRPDKEHGYANFWIVAAFGS